MQMNEKKKKRRGWITAVVLIWIIMNIRVEAGIGSTFERALDGLVGVAFLTAAVFVALEFFGIIEKGKGGEND